MSVTPSKTSPATAPGFLFLGLACPSLDSTLTGAVWVKTWVVLSKRLETRMNARALAETVRFELTDGCPSAVFKTAGLNHSPKSPGSHVF